MHRRPVDIGNGELEAVVVGDGPVTVVFENGLATPLEEWDAVVGPIAERARTLRYDHRSVPASVACSPSPPAACMSRGRRPAPAPPRHGILMFRRAGTTCRSTRPRRSLRSFSRSLAGTS